jgi:nucleotide-binding universal stress UspA family protein
MGPILVATDGSPSAEAALKKAIELAKATGGELVVVTVWHVALSAFAYEPLVVVPEVLESEREAGGVVLATAVARAAAAGVDAEPVLLEGRAVDEICREAAERNATMIVLGSHGYGPVQRLIFGSVSTGVLHHATCPVLVVRGERPAPAAKPKQAATTAA